MFESAALPFGREDTPAPLHEGFAVLRDVLAPATAADPGRYAELGWATLHGLATLARAGRLPPEGAADRRALAVDLLRAAGVGDREPRDGPFGTLLLSPPGRRSSWGRRGDQR